MFPGTRITKTKSNSWICRVIWKWKYLILAGTLLCAVGAALISLNVTKVYRVDTVIAPGVVKVEQGGKIIHIGSAQEIQSLIETGALNGRVLKRLQVPDPEALPKSLNLKVQSSLVMPDLIRRPGHATY